MLFEVVVQHRGITRVVPLPDRGVVGIGRDAEQGIQVDDPAVSRQHAVLVIEGRDVQVEDRGSANGTRVTAGGEDTHHSTNKLRIVREPLSLSPGDSVLVGGAILLLREAHDKPAGDPMAKLLQLVDQIAPTNIRVVLFGETGVGKEVLTERLHARSARAGKPLVRVHCAALSETLLESELFGHEKGSFTGALRDRVGLIESANGGTLLLDEVGEMSMSVQVKLLRVLEENAVQRVGANTPRPVDVRVVSATHRDLGALVKQGAFRQDLHYRLNGMTLRVPPLRERTREILPLASELVERIAKRPIAIDESAQAMLLAHKWPGNVRELRQVMERALALMTGDCIRADAIVIDTEEAAPLPVTLDEEIAAVERRRIDEALAQCGGNQTRAAEILGMPRRTLVERLRAWGLTKPRR